METATARRGGPRTRAFVATLVGLALIAAWTPLAAYGETRSSQEIQRDLDAARDQASQLDGELGAVRQQIGSAAEQLAQIGVRLENARAELRAAEGQVALAEGALHQAEAAREQAAADHEHALAALAETEEELAFEQQRLHEQLVSTFKYGTTGVQQGAMLLEVIRLAEDPNEFATAIKHLRTIIDVQDSTVQTVVDLRDRRIFLADETSRTRAEATRTAREAYETLIVVERLRDDAAAVAARIAADEEDQQRLLGSLRGTEAETAALLRQVAAREETLREQLVLARARESGADDRSAFPGWAGGPDIAGALCPVEGARAGRDFVNDWGYPRWPNRWHQGTDIFASRGTSVVAVADGVVVRTNTASSQTSLGGITVTYRTADGSEWYNAHLDSISSGIVPGASIARGQRVGTVGNTGNALTTPPHLHIGRRHGGSWVNPYPTISGWC